MIKVVKVGTNHHVVPDSEYKCFVKEINEGSYRGKRPLYEFIFEIAEGEHKGVQLRGFVNAHYESFSSNTKLYQWYCTATGEEELETNDTLNLDDFKDRLLLVKTSTKKSKMTKNKFSNVEVIVKYLQDL